MDQLPPLPKSLTNPQISELASQEQAEASTFSDRLDEQLGCLKREMVSLNCLIIFVFLLIHFHFYIYFFRLDFVN